jgi:hypothetical protein
MTRGPGNRASVLQSSGMGYEDDHFLASLVRRFRTQLGWQFDHFIGIHSPAGRLTGIAKNVISDLFTAKPK